MTGIDIHWMFPIWLNFVDGQEGWPPRLTSQVLTLNRLGEATAVADMNQAPVLYISGKDAPELSDMHIRWMREYVTKAASSLPSPVVVADRSIPAFEKSCRVCFQTAKGS